MRYFKHKVDAHNDIKIRRLISQHGAIGYSVFWVTLELIGSEGDCEGKLWFKKFTSNDVGSLLMLPADTIETVWASAHDLTLLNLSKEFVQCPALVNGYSDEWSNRKRTQLMTEAVEAELGKTVVEVVRKKIDRYADQIKDVLSYMNGRTGKQYRWQGKHNQLIIVARLKDGYSVDDLKKVVDNMCERWLGDEHMEQYLRPSTLFLRSKIEGYLNADKGLSAKLRSIKDGFKGRQS